MRVKSVLCATIAGACLFLAGCSYESGGEAEATTTSAADPAPDEATGENAPDAAAQDAEPFEQKETAGDDSGRFEFTYGWPREVSAIPALAQRLDAERKAALSQWRKEWDEAVADETMADCVSCRSRGYQKDWQVVADLTGYLSLSASVYGYTGGAHGGTVYDALVWDREKGAGVKPIEMFRDAQSLDTATQKAFCDQLDKARARKRGGPVKRSSDPFYDCIAPVANSTVIVGSAGGRRFDRVGFLIPAYNAGPYAEGTYEVTLPVTPAILDAVRPEYRRAFQVP